MDRYNMLDAPMYKDVSFSNIDTSMYEPYRSQIKDCLNGNKGVFIYGDVGVGKTMLMMCIAREMKDSLVIKLDTLTEQLRATYRATSTTEDYRLLEQIYRRPNLFIDDLGVESFIKNGGDNFTQRVLYKVVENRLVRGKVTSFTCNYSISQLVNERGVEKRTADRIVGSCRSIEIRGGSKRW